MGYSQLSDVKEVLRIDATDTTSDTELTNCITSADGLIDSMLKSHSFTVPHACMLYHQTKDILYVMKFLGHKNIKNTLVYVTLTDELFKDQHEYISKVAKNVKEVCALVGAGFEYVTGEYTDGGKIFRKPKYA